ncbi:ATP-binding protein [Kitasatospora sp. NPDC052896]|uniref:ATP-binding protein n=1 Tax=Kitasatospora sp. NPDC052896 TaxID=3364061 RepID=UPI0037C69AEE
MGTGAALAVDPDVVTCTLAPRYEAVRTARDFVRTTLLRWGLDDLFDDVALVASELVTNALRHAIGAPTPADAVAGAAGSTGCPVRPVFPTQLGPGRNLDDRLPIRISLVHRAPNLVCAVSDPSSDGPVTREADFVAESGRGLHLVDSFSHSWGWHPLAGAGKVVWALFEAELPALTGPVRPSEPVTLGRHRRSA